MHLTGTNQDLKHIKLLIAIFLYQYKSSMFTQVVTDTRTNRTAKSHEINTDFRRVFWVIFWFRLSSRVTCAQLTTELKKLSHTNLSPHKYGCFGFQGKSVFYKWKSQRQNGFVLSGTGAEERDRVRTLPQPECDLWEQWWSPSANTHTHIRVDHLYSIMFIYVLGCKSFQLSG